MVRMLDHGMEVKNETQIALMVIELFIHWTTADDDIA
jgi:hypothetical protein